MLFQLVRTKTEGPLFGVSWASECWPELRDTWHWLEQLSLSARFHKLQLFISDRWNKIDVAMISLFVVSFLSNTGFDCCLDDKLFRI